LHWGAIAPVAAPMAEIPAAGGQWGFGALLTTFFKKYAFLGTFKSKFPQKIRFKMAENVS